MKKQTIDEIYYGFSNVGVLAGSVLLASIIGYYTLNEIGIRKYNGLIRTLIPVALVELTASIVVVNCVDYRSMKARGDER